MTQRNLHLVGDAMRSRKEHTREEVARWHSKTSAAIAAMRRAGLKEFTVAQWMGKSESYLNRLVNGLRPWNDDLQEAFEHYTGSFALTQWDCKARGGEFYVDDLASELAAAEQRAADLKRRVAMREAA